jgi:bacteriorhodopsin
MGGTKHRRIYIILTSWILFFWSIYPIAWGLCEGSNVLSVTDEMIFYGVLDIFTKPIFAMITLFLHRNMDTKRKSSETKIQIERVDYPQNQRYDIECINTGYMMSSPEIIRSHY